MEQRLSAMQVAPDLFKKLVEVSTLTRKSTLETGLLHLIDLRASQINGCAFCVDMHCKEALADGLSQQWINLVSAWRESPVYDDAERAVLAWTEAVTRIDKTGAPDADFDALKPHFSDDQIVGLTMQLSMINFWNRMAVSMRSQHPVDRAKAA